jgi:hypothetical protein
MTESLLIIDSKNTIFRLSQIQVSATGALKFNIPIEHKVRNGIILTFTSFSIKQLKTTGFLCPRTVWLGKIDASAESLWNVDSKNTIFRPA